MYGYGKPCNISFGKEIKAKLYAEGKYFVLFQRGNIANSKEDAINIAPEVTDGASIRESYDSESYPYQAYFCDFSSKYTFYGVYSKENDSNIYVSLNEEDYTKDNINIYKIEYDTFVNQYVALLVEQGNPYKLGYKKTVSPSGKDYMDNIFLVDEETTFTKCIKDNKEYWTRGYVYSGDDNEVTICELVYDEYLNTYVAVEKEKVPSFKDSEYKIEYKSYPNGDMPGYYIKNNYLEIGYHTHTLAKTDIVKATFTNDGCTEQVYCTACKYVAKSKRNVPRIKTINISNTTRQHTGKEIKPKIIVTDTKGNRLKEGRDYDVVCSNSVNVGTATAKVVFKGYYSGEKEYNYTITKGVLAYSWALWSHNVSQGIELKWCGISKASKYIIRRRTSSSNFKIIKIINNNKVTSYIDTSVKNNNGKGYYYEIEAVKDSNYQERKANHFCIRLLKPNLTVSKKNGSIVAKWNKNNNANGYEVMLICGKSKKVYNTKNFTKTLKLAKGKTYKIYVRCYYKNFRDEYYYSEWSKGRSIRF